MNRRYSPDNAVTGPDSAPNNPLISDDEFVAAISPPDLKGRINLRIEAALQQEIEDIAEDYRYPLRSVSEVVRFCCLLGIERLRQWKPLPTLLGAIKAANALCARDRLQCDAMDLMNRVDERVNWYIEHGAFDEAIDFVGKVYSYFDKINDNFWAEYVTKEIDNRFIQWQSRIDTARAKDTAHTTLK